MKKSEKIIGIISVLALVLNLMLIPGGGILTVLSLSLLAIIYMYFGFALFNGIRFRKILQKESYQGISGWRIAGAVAAGLALSATTIGILFRFQSYPGARINLVIGVFGLLIITVVSLVKYNESRSAYYSGILKRAAIVGGIGLTLFLIPRTKLIEIKYRNHPGFVQALKESINDPDNKELQDKLEEEREKMYNER